MDSRFTDAERLNTMLPRRVERLQKTRACPARPKAHDFSKNLAMNTLVMSENRAVTKASLALGSATLLSRIAGLARDIVISRLFGVGLATDVFFAVFQIPNMLRRLFAEGSFSPAFTKTFTSTLVNDGDNKARELTNSCFTLLAIITAAITLSGVLFSSAIIGVMLTGFKSDPAKFELAVTFNRLMIPYIFFISLVSLCTGILNSLRHFFIPGISTLFLNLSIVLSALFLRKLFNEPTTALAVGVLVGGCLQLAVQFTILMKIGFPIKPAFNFNLPGVHKIFKLMLPSAFGDGVYYLNLAVSAALSTLLPQGSISFLYYAQRFFEFPQGVVTASVTQSILPSISRLAAEGNIEGMKETISYCVQLTLLITVPAMVGLIVCARPIISLVFMGGTFSYISAINSASALMFYAIGLPFVAIARIATRAFIALDDTKTPALLALIAFIINICLSIILMPQLKHCGLALATSLTALCNMVMLLWVLRRKVGAFNWRVIGLTAIKSGVASLPMGIVVWYGCAFMDWSQTGAKLMQGSVLAGLIISGCAIYMWVMKHLQSEEMVEALLRKHTHTYK